MYGSEVGAAYYLHAYKLLCGIKLCYLGGGGLYAYLWAEVYLELIRGVTGLLVGACFDYMVPARISTLLNSSTPMRALS